MTSVALVLSITRDRSSPPEVPARYRIYYTGRAEGTAGAAGSSRAYDLEQVEQELHTLGIPAERARAILEDLERTGDAEVTLPEAGVGPRIVRAWFDTVLNPILAALQRELAVLSAHNWTWRFRPTGLERIAPIRHYIEYRVLANYEQFLELNPDTVEPIQTHDRAVAEVGRLAGRLHSALISDEHFRTLCEWMVEPESLSKLGVREPSDVFGAYPQEDWCSILAEHVINDSGELSGHYPVSRLWNAHRGELLAIRQRPSIKVKYDELLQAGDRLSSGSSALLGTLREKRRALSLMHDIPYVSEIDLKQRRSA